MNNKLAYRKNQTEALILLFKALELKSLEDNFSEVFLFLARYSFLFENTENSVNSCTLEASQIYTEQAFSDWSMKFVDPTGNDITVPNVTTSTQVDVKHVSFFFPIKISFKYIITKTNFLKVKNIGVFTISWLPINPTKLLRIKTIAKDI